MDISNKFLTAMRKAGFEPDCKIISDGKLHRFRDWLDNPERNTGGMYYFRNFQLSEHLAVVGVACLKDGRSASHDF